MKSYQALIKRELLEHRGAFLYAPAILLAALFLLTVFGLITEDPDMMLSSNMSLGGTQLYRYAMAGVFALWSVYLIIALFFYYADSFSADRRNNSLLFWKSMPQSDLKVLTGKALAGITIFPALLLAFAMITGLLVYLISFLVVAKMPFLPMIGPFDMVSNWVQMGIVGAVFFILNILWYAPFLGWVAGLSTLFQRWSIPLAFLIPGALLMVESLTSLSASSSQPIADFLAYRLGTGLLDDKKASELFTGDNFSAISLIVEITSSVNWSDMAIGLVFAALVVYLASEYRRRRIEA